jgi:Tfp pilus assembly protein PilP
MRFLSNLHRRRSLSFILKGLKRLSVDLFFKGKTKKSLILMCSLGLCSFILEGCGEEAPQYSNKRGIPSHLRRKSKASGKKKKKVSQGQKNKQIRIPERLKRKELFNALGWRSTQKIRGDLDQLRDPFTPSMPETKKQEEVKVDPESIQQKLEVAVKADFRDLKFTGALTGIAVNQALLEDSSGRGYTVRVGDIIGQSPDYVRVAGITSNQIRYEWVSRGNESAQLPPLRYSLRSDDSNLESSQAKP